MLRKKNNLIIPCTRKAKDNLNGQRHIVDRIVMGRCQNSKWQKKVWKRSKEKIVSNVATHSMAKVKD